MSVLDESPVKLSGTDYMGWAGFPFAVHTVTQKMGESEKSLSFSYSTYLNIHIHSGRSFSKQFTDISTAIQHARALNIRWLQNKENPKFPAKKLFWFHAFNRDSAAEVVKIIKNGLTPTPPEKSATRRNEQVLGIETPSVYAYLGTTTELFGDSAFALDFSSVSGLLSPFDTGGLVKHIAPVNTWADQYKADYLSQYSWGADAIYICFDDYPGNTAKRIAAYLGSVRPERDGPHSFWGGDRVANIWSEPFNGWQAWTWEMRVPEVLPIDSQIVKWTCTADLFAEISMFALDSPAETNWYQGLFKKYVRGGPSQLLLETRQLQEST